VAATNYSHIGSRTAPRENHRRPAQHARGGRLTNQQQCETPLTAARLNLRASSITGTICGVRIEDINDPLMQKIRYLDKLVDELARGRSMDKILRA